MLTLISGADVYGPEVRGQKDILIVGDRIAKLGTIDRGALERLGLPLEVIDGQGCIAAPGLIDPHEHLLGGSGEKGFATQTPEITFSELVAGGITTVVGCLGVDATTKTMPGLLAKAKGLNEEGLTAYLYSGGYNVPPVTLTGSLRSDLLYIQEVIGAGEIAVSDHRSTEPSAAELARLVRDAYVGGMLSGKAGVTHFHVGEGKRGLVLLRALLDEYEMEPELLYPTHVERSERLMEEAIALTEQGVTVDVDTVERDLARWVRFYLDHGGLPSHLTASSDASINSPGTLFDQLRSCCVDEGLPLELILPLATANTARVLKLPSKGRLAEGADADLLVLRQGSLELIYLFARGKRLLKDGKLQQHESFLAESNRRVTLHGQHV